MDDLQFVARSKNLTGRFGLWRGILENTREHLRGDRAWGLFRPSFSLYSSTVYLLSPNLAYFTRFLTFIGMIAFALLAVSKLLHKAALKPGRHFYSFLLMTILSIHPLYDTLGFISLQEYSGLFLAMFGLFLFTDERHASNAWYAAGCFLLAALFKTPFVWLLLGAGIMAVFSRQKIALGIFCSVSAAATIGVAASFAKSGLYTAHFNEFRLSTVMITILSFFKQTMIPVLVCASAVFFGWRSKKRNFHVSAPYSALLLGAGSMYLANLLPWGSPSYHMGPPIFLMILGGWPFPWRRQL